MKPSILLFSLILFVHGAFGITPGKNVIVATGTGVAPTLIDPTPTSFASANGLALSGTIQAAATAAANAVVSSGTAAYSIQSGTAANIVAPATTSYYPSMSVGRSDTATNATGLTGNIGAFQVTGLAAVATSGAKSDVGLGNVENVALSTGTALTISGTIPITKVQNLPTLLATGTTALTNAAAANSLAVTGTHNAALAQATANAAIPALNGSGTNTTLVNPNVSGTSFGQAAFLNVGTTAGTVLSGTFGTYTNPSTAGTARSVSSKFGDCISVKDFGAAGDNATDDTAAFQAALNSGSDGTLFVPSGKYVISGTLIVNGATRIVGTGAGSISNATGSGSVIGSGIIPGGATIYCASGTSNFITFNKNGGGLEDIAIVNTGTSAPTGGCGVKWFHGTGAHMTRVIVYGFYNDVWWNNGYTWTMTDCLISDPSNYGMLVQDQQIPDGGDASVIGCTFTMFIKSYSPAAAIHYISGGGLKVVNCKFNGGDPAGKFARMIDTAFEVGTSDLLITNNSFENYSDWGIYLGTSGTSSFFDNVLIKGNQISFGSGIKVDSDAVKHVLISENVLTHSANIYLAQGHEITVGPNTFDTIGTTALLVGGGNFLSDIKIAPQNDYELGYVVENNQSIGVSVQYDYSNLLPSLGSSGTYTAYRMAPSNYTGGVVNFQVSGNVSGVGGFMLRGTRSFTMETGGVTVATVGTDVSIGTAASGINLVFDTSAVSGEVQLKVGNTSGRTASIGSHVTIDGYLTTFKQGP